MPIKPAPDPNNPGAWIWVDSVTGAPATQPGGPDTPFIAPSDQLAAQPSPPPTGPNPSPGRPPGSAPFNRLAQELGQSGWKPIPGSLQKEPPKLIDNPRAGLQKADGSGPEPLQVAQDSNRWQVVFSTGEGGANRLVYLTPAGAPPTAGQDPTSDQFGWQIASAPSDVPQGSSKDEQNARIAEAQSAAETARAKADQAALDLKKVQEDTREREYNQAHGNGYLTHQEVAKNQQEGIANGLTQQQIDARKQEIENNNRNTAVSNEIAALNANTAAQNAATQATASLARTKYEEGSLSLDNAKFEHTKAQDEVANRNAEAKIQLEQLTQQQANQIAQGGLTIRGQELAQRTASEAAQLEQRKAEQAQAAQTAERTAQTQLQVANTNAASNAARAALEAQSQAAQTGAGLLQNRVNAGVSGLNNFVSGMASNRNLLSWPSGLGEKIVGGLQEWITGLGGGQPVYDAAAAMVNAAHPSISQNPQLAQQAYTALRGMMDLYKAQTGQDYLPPNQRQGYTAPGPPSQSTYNPSDLQWNQPPNAADVPGRVMGPGGVVTTPPLATTANPQVSGFTSPLPLIPTPVVNPVRSY